MGLGGGLWVVGGVTDSRERGVESQPCAAAPRGYSEDAEDPMVAPADHDIRQSGRVLELQNRDLSS